MVAVFQITAIIFEVPTGYIADKFGRKISVQIGLVLLLICTSLWIFAQNYIQFSILASIWMLGFTCISGSLEAYVYDKLKSHNKTDLYDNVISKSTSISFLFAGIGSVLGAWLFSINITYPFVLQFITFALGLITISLMNSDYKEIKYLQKTTKIDILSGFKNIRNSKTLQWLSIFISIFFAFLMYFINSINSPYLLSLNIFKIEYLGLFFAIMSVYQSYLSNQFARLKNMLSDTQLVILLLIVQIIALLGMGYLIGMLGILAYILFVSIEPFQSLLINSYAQKNTDSNSRATTISSIKMINALFASVIGILCGWLFDNSTFQFGFIIIAMVLFILSSGLLLMKSKLNIKL